MSKEEAITEVERYFVFPGQACAYMVGCQMILKLREKAQSALGERFDLKEFHDGRSRRVTQFSHWSFVFLFSGYSEWSVATGYPSDDNRAIYSTKK